MSHSLPAHPVFLTLKTLVYGTALLCLGACKGGYIYTFNDNVVYSPQAVAKLPTNVLRDAALQGCLNQYVEAAGLKALADVHLLACPGSGVESLAGIGLLTGLEELELSDNKIKDLSPLAPLKNLRVLGLRNNPVKSVEPLMKMTLLRFLSLQGNDQLPCSEINKLKSRLGNTLSEPAHCSK